MESRETDLNTQLKNIMYAQSVMASLEIVEESLCCIRSDINNIQADISKQCSECVNQMEMVLEDLRDRLITKYRKEWESIIKKLEMLE